LENLFKGDYSSVTSNYELPPIVSDKAPDYVKTTLAKIMERSFMLVVRNLLPRSDSGLNGWESIQVI
ncbi:MAG: hypothetical protein N3A65_09995, partial [candidate division WOR-3 bacterium]|nr:hypothetical protein [candidate division WOR-3 bacterium]